MKIFTYRLTHAYGMSKVIHLISHDELSVLAMLGTLYDPSEETCTFVDVEDIPPGRVAVIEDWSVDIRP